jgi:hypothetical protein
MNLVDFVKDPGLLNLTISSAQEVLLRAIDGLPLVDDEQRQLWEDCTGRSVADYQVGHRYPEVTVVCGARSGKDSRIAVPAVLYEAVFGGHDKHLNRGERGIVPLVAQDLRASRVAFGYARDYLLNSPDLKPLVSDVKANEISLSNGLTIACFPCTAKSLRGWSTPAGCLDELAFFDVESADADVEVQMSILRGGVNFPSPRIFKISTPFAKAGLLYNDFQQSFGKADLHRLVWRASTWVMNPSIKAERFARYATDDPTRYAREFEAIWQDALSVLLPAAWVDQAVVEGLYELAPEGGHTYVATCDASGGGADSFTFCVAHRVGDLIVQDVIKGWSRTGGQAPNLEGVVGEITDIAKRYGCRSITGDRYSAGWVRQAFERAGLTYVEAPVDRSRAYLEAEPLFAQGRICILDHPKQTRELKVLEKRPRAGGSYFVDAPRGQHEDHANALALAAAVLQAAPQVQVRIRRISHFD